MRRKARWGLPYKEGEYRVECDRCGRVTYLSNIVKERHTGFMVCSEHVEMDNSLEKKLRQYRSRGTAPRNVKPPTKVGD